jgi:hypothetical protein
VHCDRDPDINLAALDELTEILQVNPYINLHETAREQLVALGSHTGADFILTGMLHDSGVPEIYLIVVALGECDLMAGRGFRAGRTWEPPPARSPRVLALEGTEPPRETVVGPVVDGREGAGAVAATAVVAELGSVGEARRLQPGGGP